jgi:hypothetical protein
MCSMSNFDAYFVTRHHKGPKPFVFAVKSTDNLSYFEDTADYVHVFSCGQKDGEKWVEKILLTRVRCFRPVYYSPLSDVIQVLCVTSRKEHTIYRKYWTKPQDPLSYRAAETTWSSTLAAPCKCFCSLRGCTTFHHRL